MTYRVNVILYIEHDKLLLRYRRAKSQEWPKQSWRRIRRINGPTYTRYEDFFIK